MAHLVPFDLGFRRFWVSAIEDTGTFNFRKKGKQEVFKFPHLQRFEDGGYCHILLTMFLLVLFSVVSTSAAMRELKFECSRTGICSFCVCRKTLGISSRSLHLSQCCLRFSPSLHIRSQLANGIIDNAQEASSSSTTTTLQDNPISPTATATPSFSMFIKNFNLLYDPTSDHSVNSINELDLATAFGSCRFFFSSLGRSNSIIECSTAADGQKKKVMDNSVVVLTFLSNPYLDFRRSM
ncbi:hypothetical protein K1719_004451 [Acacia pycnantha]|nr:hypothetical protein K1719_004451 [Acacia pycnantha]